MFRYAGMRFIAIFLIILSVQKVMAKPLCTFKNSTKIYLNAKTKKMFLQVDKYTPLTSTGKKQNGRIEVENYEGRKFWVSRKQLSGKISCLTVTKKTKLRTGPGNNFALAEEKTADRAESFQEIGIEDGWVQVKDTDGNKAWINLENIWQPTNKMRISFGPE